MTLADDAEGRKHEHETGIDVNSRAGRDPATITSRKMRDGVSGLQRQVRVRSDAVLSTVGTTDAYLSSCFLARVQTHRQRLPLHYEDSSSRLLSNMSSYKSPYFHVCTVKV